MQWPADLCSKPGAMISPPRLPLEDWVHKLMGTQFFASCAQHGAVCKNAQATFFCVDCAGTCGALCQHCMADHSGHTVLQIRRYVYCDVVRAADISPFVDITGVQSYIINQAKVVFLNHRPQAKVLPAGTADSCGICHRALREGCNFCSLACKVKDLTVQGKLGPASADSDSGSDVSSGACGAGGVVAKDTSRLARLQRPSQSGAGTKRRSSSYDVSLSDFKQQLKQHKVGAFIRQGPQSSSSAGMQLSCGLAPTGEAAAVAPLAMASAVAAPPPPAAAPLSDLLTASALHITPLDTGLLPSSCLALALDGVAVAVTAQACGWDSRRSSDSDHSDVTLAGARHSDTGCCSRRKQTSPQRSPVL